MLVICLTNYNMSIEEYYQEMQKGLTRCGLIESEDGIMARFLGGLNTPI